MHDRNSGEDDVGTLVNTDNHLGLDRSFQYLMPMPDRSGIYGYNFNFTGPLDLLDTGDPVGCPKPKPRPPRSTDGEEEREWTVLLDRRLPGRQVDH